MKFKQATWFVVMALVIGGIGGVLLNRFAIPYAATIPGFSWVKNLESSNPVVINRREEVQFSEGVDLVNLSKQIGTYTASIYTGSAPNLKFAGNGIVTSSDGMIIASKANLPSSGTLIVVLNDGSSFTGTIRALDPKSELAVITIPATNLAFAQFADASALQTSQRLIFLGRSNAEFTHDFSEAQVTHTISNQSSVDRVYYSENLENTIQTDARINSDFIGGPIANLNGAVVGMVNSNLSVLIGEDLQSAVSSYLSQNKIIRPSLGIKYLNLSNELAKLRNLPQGGILIVSVDDSSPAKAAGLLPGDLITSLDNSDLSSNNFEQILNSHPASQVPASLLRNGSKVNLIIKAGSK